MCSCYILCPPQRVFLSPDVAVRSIHVNWQFVEPHQECVVLYPNLMNSRWGIVDKILLSQKSHNYSLDLIIPGQNNISKNYYS